MSTVRLPRAVAESPRWRLLYVAALVVVIAGVYWKSVFTPFMFDDLGAVTKNASIRQLGSWEVLNPPADGSTTTGRPLLNLSFAINYAISGHEVWSYHIGNLVLHILAALALMYIVRSVAMHRSVLGEKGAPTAMVAFFAALLWAVHPLLTESVVCVAQRTEVLCGVFYLATLAFFVRATTGAGSRRVWLLLSVLCSLAGMASKEVMVTAPVLVLLYDRTFVAGTFVEAWRRRRRYYLALASTWILLVLLVVRAGGSRGAAAGFGLGVSWWSYLLKQSEAIILYIRLSIFPYPLVLDYGSDVVTSMAEVWWQGPLVLALVGAGIWAVMHRPALGFCAAWFFVILAPSSSFVPLITQTMAEHRMYLPLAALVAALVVVLFRNMARYATWSLVGVIVLASFTTVLRIHDYRDVVSIWQDTVSKHPSSSRAENNLAWALQNAGRSDEANVHYARVVALMPEYVLARYNWGVALLDQGKVREAIDQFEAAVRLAPSHPDLHVNLGSALMQVSRPHDALRSYETALKIKPTGDVHYNISIALMDVGRPSEAIDHLRVFLKDNPTSAETHYQLGRALEMIGDARAAESAFAQTLALSSEHLGAHRKLGMTLARAGSFDEASRHFEAVERLAPSDADAKANLGNVRLMQGRTSDAIALYEAALRLRPDDPRTRENLRVARETAP